MSESADISTTNALRGARRAAVIGIIVSLSITAVIGIATLLTGDFGDTQSRILGTTLLIAAFSITSLCHLAVAGRALRIVGYVGIAVSVVALIAGVVLIWRDWGDYGSLDVLFKAFAIFSILAVSFAHANLLLLLGERKRPVIRIGLFVTVGLIAVVASMLILPILTDGDIPGDNDDYWRVFGVVAILDALGTIVLPVMSRFLRDDPGAAIPTVLTLSLSPELSAELDVAAAARSISREQAALDAIRGYTGGSA